MTLNRQARRSHESAPPTDRLERRHLARCQPGNDREKNQLMSERFAGPVNVLKKKRTSKNNKEMKVSVYSLQATVDIQR